MSTTPTTTTGNDYDVSTVQIHNNSDFSFYKKGWKGCINIDEASEHLCAAQATAESAISTALDGLKGKDAGQLDQSKLMGIQINMSRWQLASQMLSNSISGIGTGLKNTVQNVGR